MLDAAGFKEATITASSDLDEYLIDSISQDAKIDPGCWNHLITSRDCPSLAAFIN